MPLTHKGQVIEAAMEKKYGAKKGEEVFYASRNKGTITGVDSAVRKDAATSYMDSVRSGDAERIRAAADSLLGRK